MAKKKKAGKKAKTKRAVARRKAARKRPAAQKTTRKPAVKRVKKPAAPPPRKRASSWLDESSQMPIIERYARQLGSFIEAMADGVIEASELKTQEARLVQLMKDIESKLDDNLHAKVTKLLCELTAYDIMQMLHAMHGQRPQTVFQG